MVQEHLLEFIRKNLNEGYDKPRLTEVLLKHGYDQAVIDEAFTQVEGGTPASQEPQSVPADAQQPAASTEQPQQQPEQQAPVEAQQASAAPIAQESAAQDTQQAQQNTAEEKPKKNISKIITFALLGVVVVAVLILLAMWMMPSESDPDEIITPKLPLQPDSDEEQVVKDDDADTEQLLLCPSLDLTKNISRNSEGSILCFLNAITDCRTTNHTILVENKLQTVIVNGSNTGSGEEGICPVEIESRACIIENVIPLTGNSKADEIRLDNEKKRMMASCAVNKADSSTICTITSSEVQENGTGISLVQKHVGFIDGLANLESGQYTSYSIDCP